MGNYEGSKLGRKPFQPMQQRYSSRTPDFLNLILNDLASLFWEKEKNK